MPGLFQLGKGLVTGEDAIGNKIGSTASGWPGFFQRQLTPIFLSSMDQRKKGTGISEWESMIGIRPMTAAAEDPKGFYDMLDRIDKRNLNDQRRRAIYENKIYINPRPIPGGGSSALDNRTREIMRRRQGQ
jgi:hypothetical protein